MSRPQPLLLVILILSSAVRLAPVAFHGFWWLATQA